MTPQDTICALATPPAPAALALIRISGKSSLLLAHTLAGKTLAPNQATYCKLRPNGQWLDEAILTTWAAPRSHTGEDMAEISCHGNMLIVERTLAWLCANGARMANPGEFTQRAFLNGKIDLTRAEAVMDLIHATTERTLRAAQRLHKGALAAHVSNFQEELLQTVAHLEAYIDFPDEDITPETGALFQTRIQTLLDRTQTLLDSAQKNKILRDGLRVAIAGAPNAGKSSLLNALLQRERAIVSHIPGTTRDTIEETISLNGIPVRLIDTAGLRETGDEIEQLGLERTRQACADADLILHLVDGTSSHQDQSSLPFSTQAPVLLVQTKIDRPDSRPIAGFLPISALNGTGLEELKNAIIQTLHIGDGSDSFEEIALHTRHETCLQLAATHLRAALQSAAQNNPPELTGSDLRAALHAYNEIVGITTNEDILDRLFSRFCIGK